MKRVTVISIAIAALLVAAFAATRYFRPTAPVTTPGITGEWTLDSIAAPDSSGKLVKQLSLTLDENSDSGSIRWNFMKDSLLKRTAPYDSSSAKYYLQDSTLNIEEAVGYLPYSVVFVSDSILHLRSSDGTLFVLKRK